MGDLGFPASPDELGPEWYTTALRSRGALGDTTSVATAEAAPIGVGVGILSLLWRVMFTYDERHRTRHGRPEAAPHRRGRPPDRRRLQLLRP